MYFIMLLTLTEAKKTKFHLQLLHSLEIKN